MKNDTNLLGVPFGKSPDRSKNISVYSQGPSQGPSVIQSSTGVSAHAISQNLLN